MQTLEAFQPAVELVAETNREQVSRVYQQLLRTIATHQVADRQTASIHERKTPSRPFRAVDETTQGYQTQSLNLPKNGGRPDNGVDSPWEVHHGQKATKLYARVKLEAVKLITEKGYSVAEAARVLDVGETLLRSWKQALDKEGDQAFPGHGNLPPLEEELRQLRAENKRLQMERDI